MPPLRTAEISVLMSVYGKEKPEHLNQSLKSLWEQSEAPAEIVLVEDGPLPAPLQDVIRRYKKKRNIPLKAVRLEKSRGLGPALDAGLGHCRFDWVARMDSDDICHPDRLKLQACFVRENPGVSAVGGYISEFKDSPGSTIGLRKVPLTLKGVRFFCKFRNPMNHMTVLFKRHDVLKAGGYRDFTFFEDYDLWIRMLTVGMELRNIPAVLVWARFNERSLERRRGLEYARQERKLFRNMRALGQINVVFWGLTVFLRNFTRVGPGWLQKFLYKHLVRT